MSLLNKSTLYNNIVSLSTLQLANYIFPLIVIPYFVRTLGLYNYGIIAFIQSLIAYFAILINFGFNLSAVSDIAKINNQSERISYFWKTIFSKVSLLIFCFILLLVITNFEPFKANKTLYYIAFIMLIENCLFPVWYFQGIQKMKYIPIIQISIRTITTIMIFVFVKGQSDLNLAIAIPAFGNSLIGLTGFFYILSQIKFKFYLPKFIELTIHFKSSWSLFIGQVATTFFNDFLVLILGIFGSYSSVAIFVAADKIIKAVTALIAPISWAIYPQSSIMFNKSKKIALLFLSKIYRYGVVIFAILAICLFTFSPQLAHIISGARNDSIALLLKIMSLVPLSIFINNIYGTQILINTGYRKLFTQALIIAAIYSIIVSIVLIPKYHEIGAGLVSLTTEILIAGLMKYYCDKNQLKLLEYH